MSFGSPKETHFLNPMRYHGAFIENTYCHQPPSTATQSIGIYDHFRVSPIYQSLLVILAQTQYLLKVESSYNIVAWWIMKIDSLCFMIHRRSCLVCITYTSTLIIGNSSWWPRQAIPSIRRWCTTVSTELPKFMNQLWTTYLLTKNP